MVNIINTVFNSVMVSLSFTMTSIMSLLLIFLILVMVLVWGVQTIGWNQTFGVLGWGEDRFFLGRLMGGGTESFLTINNPDFYT